MTSSIYLCHKKHIYNTVKWKLYYNPVTISMTKINGVTSRVMGIISLEKAYRHSADSPSIHMALGLLLATKT
jgi:hypothetical protein